MVLGIYGTGGSGREIKELISKYNELNSRWEGVVFIDDTKAAGLFDNTLMLPFEQFKRTYDYKTSEIVIAVGEPFLRRMLHERIKNSGYSLASIISPKANVSETATIGHGVVVKDGTIVSSKACVDDNAWIQSHSIIGHDVHICSNVQVSANVFVGGRTIIEENVFIGAGALIREDTCVGAGSIVSMGAVVLKNVTKERVVMGNPAREIASNTVKQVFRS